jgi:hypothetical protein
MNEYPTENNNEDNNDDISFNMLFEFIAQDYYPDQDGDLMYDMIALYHSFEGKDKSIPFVLKASFFEFTSFEEAKKAKESLINTFPKLLRESDTEKEPIAAKSKWLNLISYDAPYPEQNDDWDY